MFFVFAALFGVTAIQASPTHPARQSITPLTSKQIDFFTPYTYYASTGYCKPAQTLAWNCGANCDANADFRPVASGGNGDTVQYWYVGYDPHLDTVVVAHQGTNPAEIEPVVTDVDFFLTNLDPTLFPGLNPDIQVHNGFADEQASTAMDVLTAVRQAISEHPTRSVTVVGHSLGAAIALLDSIYLPLWLPDGITFRTIGYGLPRVGNQAFANYVDSNLHLTHINNKEDPIPDTPPTFFGFVHPSGEIHIQDSGKWVSCPGQDNLSPQCTTGDLLGIPIGNINDHAGPYNGIMIGC